MSIYKQALLDARELKKVAEENAKRALIEAATPAIKKIIAEELSSSSSASILFEEEQQDDLLTQVADATVNSDLPASPTPSVPSNEMGGVDAPIKVMGTHGDDALKMPLPGPDGKLVVDFDDLFVAASPSSMTPPSADVGPASAEQQAAVSGMADAASSLAGDAGALSGSEPGGAVTPEPVDVNPTVPGTEGDLTAQSLEEPVSEIPMEPEPKTETVEMFQESFEQVKKQVTRVYEGRVPGASSLVQEALQEKLFNLLERLETLSNAGKVSEKLSKIFETRLEILHRKLKDGESLNTYERIQKDKEEDMASKSLKEYADKLLAESGEVVKGGDMTSPADVHKTEKPMKVANSQEQAADKAGSHAMSASEPTVTLTTEEVAAKALEEELQAILSESEGDSLVTEPGKQDLAGAASSIPDEKVGQVDPTKSTAASPTNPPSHVLSVKEGKGKKEVKVPAKDLAKATKKLKKENLQRQIARLQEQLDECGDMGESSPMGTGEGMSSEMPMTENELGAGEAGTVINLNFDLADLVPELSGLGDDDEIEITDDEDDLSGSMDSTGDVSSLGDTDDGVDVASMDSSDMDDDSDSLGDDDEEEDSLSALMESSRKSKKSTQSRTPVKNKILEENKVLRTRLLEQQLFNAKTVHFGVFLKNKNLSNEQKQKIAAYLDRAKTITEVRSTYDKIKSVLEGVTKARSAKSGSSSKPSTTVMASKPITESSQKENLFEGKSLVEEQKNRLMVLAGIKKK